MIWLIAEDEADILNLIATMCRIWGHTPLTFTSGGKAWDWLDTIEAGTNKDPLPEFALMDIRMPGKKGNEVANRMRTIPVFKDIPIALMTAFALNQDERDAIIKNDGVDDIISKPLPTFDDLRIVLERLIENKRANTQRSEQKI